ncbi:hypothetical protein [Virgisporangium ochraceum]|uniref:Uncharacterized protein n=1 Tax=Virgisporangium ochraceum TaxID=65505 RepID=A0A8J4EB53_9ACTN|nr:hypothetical protein [Virgisporangium ochraceum]GIJ68083.1 hypothetical protein Voc01_030000 [Virgisporangium ochraceum]
MTVDEAERVRALLHDVGFPEPRHDIGETVRIGRRRRATRWTTVVAAGAAALVGAAVAVQGGPAAPPPRRDDEVARPATDCDLENLPLPDGVTSATVTGIDPTGRFVVGSSDRDAGILWTDGQPRLLPAGSGGAAAVNASGVVVGTAGTGDASPAWVYRDGRVERLPVPPDGGASAVSINAAGDIAGTIAGSAGTPAPIVWPAGEPRTYRLYTTPGPPVVRAITDTGVVVGGIEGRGPYRWNAYGDGQALPIMPAAAGGVAVDATGTWATGLLHWSLDRPDPRVNSYFPGGRTAVRWNLATGEVTATGIDTMPVAVDPTGRVLLPQDPPRLVGPDNVQRPLPVDRRSHVTVAVGMSDNGVVVGYGSARDKDPATGLLASRPLRWVCVG